MAGGKRGLKNGKKSAKTENRGPVLEELGTIKRLLMLQLVGSGVKPIDIAVILGVDKSVISGLIPVRKLLVGKHQAKKTVLDMEATEITKRLDSLTKLVRKNKVND